VDDVPARQAAGAIVRLTFTIPGPPVPKARARVVTDKQGKTRGVTPAKTRAYEKHIAMVAMGARSHCSAWPWRDTEARFGLSVRVYRSRDAGDLGNYEKTVEDAFNGVLWPDDRQMRRRGEGGVFDCEKGRERIEVEVWVIEVDSRANTR
jgi:Holliday junction resolvase RusA-like endonuclease